MNDARALHRVAPTPWLTLLHTPGWAEGIVSARLLMPVGAYRDVDYLPGASHLCAEMLIHGTPDHDSEAVAEMIEDTGASLAFSAGRDFISASLQCLAPDADIMLPLLLDLLANPAMPARKLTLEREVALMDLLEQEDQPLGVAMRLFETAVFQGHPYALDTLGDSASLARIDRDMLCGFHAHEISAAPMVAAVAGHPHPEALAEQMAERLHSGHRQTSTPVPPATGYAPQTVREAREVDRAWLVLGGPAPSVHHPDMLPMAMLNAILGGAQDSRLFTEIRERRGLAYVVSSSFAARRGAGLFCVYLGADPIRYQEALQCVREELRRLTHEPVTEEERSGAVRHIHGSGLMAMESQHGFLASHIHHEILGLGAEYVERLPELLEQVTVEDIMRVAQTWLPEPTLCLVVPETMNAAGP